MKFFSPSNLEIITPKTLLLNERWILQSKKKKCYAFITYNGIEVFFHNFETSYFQGQWHIKLKKIRKIERCDGLYNNLMCEVSIIFFKVHHISKEIFSWPILNISVKKVKGKALLNWTWKNMSTLIPF